MPESGMDWIVTVGVIAAIVSAFFALRSPMVRRKLGLKVLRSSRVDISATDATEADVSVKRSEDVSIKLGD